MLCFLVFVTAWNARQTIRQPGLRLVPTNRTILAGLLPRKWLVLTGRALGAVGRVGIDFKGKHARLATLTKPRTFRTERSGFTRNTVAVGIVVIHVVGMVRNKFVWGTHFAFEMVQCWIVLVAAGTAHGASLCFGFMFVADGAKFTGYVFCFVVCTVHNESTGRTLVAAGGRSGTAVLVLSGEADGAIFWPVCVSAAGWTKCTRNMFGVDGAVVTDVLSKWTKVAGNGEAQVRLVLVVTGRANLTRQQWCCAEEVSAGRARFAIDVAGAYVGLPDRTIQATDYVVVFNRSIFALGAIRTTSCC